MSNEVQDTGMVLKIAHLYPTLMSVAADRGNLYAAFSDERFSVLSFNSVPHLSEAQMITLR